MKDQQKFAERMRKEYGAQSAKESKLQELQQLDSTVRRPAALFAYLFGIVGSLVLGVGMCIVMNVISSLFPLGVVVGVVGIGMVAINYFLYRIILKARKKKYAARIVALTDELLGGNA